MVRLNLAKPGSALVSVSPALRRSRLAHVRLDTTLRGARLTLTSVSLAFVIARPTLKGAWDKLRFTATETLRGAQVRAKREIFNVFLSAPPASLSAAAVSFHQNSRF